MRTLLSVGSRTVSSCAGAAAVGTACGDDAEALVRATRGQRRRRGRSDATARTATPGTLGVRRQSPDDATRAPLSPRTRRRSSLSRSTSSEIEDKMKSTEGAGVDRRDRRATRRPSTAQARRACVRSIGTAATQARSTRTSTHFGAAVGRTWTPEDADQDGGAATGGKYESDEHLLGNRASISARPTAKTLLWRRALQPRPRRSSTAPITEATIDRLLAAVRRDARALANRTDADCRARTRGRAHRRVRLDVGTTSPGDARARTAEFKQRSSTTKAAAAGGRKCKRRSRRRRCKVYFLEWENGRRIATVIYLPERRGDQRSGIPPRARKRSTPSARRSASSRASRASRRTAEDHRRADRRAPRDRRDHAVQARSRDTAERVIAFNEARSSGNRRDLRAARRPRSETQEGLLTDAPEGPLVVAAAPPSSSSSRASARGGDDATTSSSGRRRRRRLRQVGAAALLRAVRVRDVPRVPGTRAVELDTATRARGDRRHSRRARRRARSVEEGDRRVAARRAVLASAPRRRPARRAVAISAIRLRVAARQPLPHRAAARRQDLREARARDARSSNTRGLAAAEYLLFYEGTDNACAPTATMNTGGAWAALGAPEHREAQARVRARDRRRHAAARRRAGRRVGSAQRQLRRRRSRRAARTSVFVSQQMAFNAVSNAFFYVDDFVKNMKLGKPAGFAGAAPRRLASPTSSRRGQSARRST